ncbi:MAG: glycogen/starch synthase, partial [Planctomycetota bacterium]
EQPDFFDRPSLYGDAHGDYQDNASRFIFFCRAVLQVISRVAGSVDIVQCNDWQSGLIPAYCRLRYDDHSWMHHAKTVMTVHNLAYQGNFWQHDYSLTDLDYQHFRPAELEFYGHLNLLKAGIMMADVVTTVSPRYAEEIQTDQHGCGLQGVLRHRSDRLAGIINGIDPLVWDPMSDAYLETPYNVQNWQSGKRDARRQLFREMNTEWQLDDDKQRPTLIGLVGRFAYQKGWDLVLEAMQMLIDDDDPLRFIVLGSGDADYERQLRQIAEERPDRLALHVGFSDRLAHLIESASDAFAMPSRYEPCGLNQLYSLRYGTVPIVNPTGGLADTVVDSSAETLSSRQATGFYLRDYSGTGLANSIRSASAVRREEPENWSQIVETGMKQDWTWRRSAVRYEQLYANTLALAKES